MMYVLRHGRTNTQSINVNKAAHDERASKEVRGNDPGGYIEKLQIIQDKTKNPETKRIAQQEIDYVRKNDRQYKNS